MDFSTRNDDGVTAWCPDYGDSWLNEYAVGMGLRSLLNCFSYHRNQFMEESDDGMGGLAADTFTDSY